MELGNYIFGNSRGDFSVNRDWQEEFSEFLRTVGFDSYGHMDTPQLEAFMKFENNSKNSTMYFENEVFIMRPYYWGDDEEIAEKPNFVFKPAQFELSWYKYPLRDSYMNQEVTKEQFLDMLQKMKNSLSQ